MTKFYHFNFNVVDLDRSLEFYHKALNLSPVRTKEAGDGSFKLVFLGDETGSDFQLELTWLRDRGTSPTTWASASSIWPSAPTSLRPSTPGTRRWAASALRTWTWASTSSPTRTATGLRLCRRRTDGQG